MFSVRRLFSIFNLPFFILLFIAYSCGQLLFNKIIAIVIPYLRISWAAKLRRSLYLVRDYDRKSKSSRSVQFQHFVHEIKPNKRSHSHFKNNQLKLTSENYWEIVLYDELRSKWTALARTELRLERWILRLWSREVRVWYWSLFRTKSDRKFSLIPMFYFIVQGQAENFRII